MFVSPRNLLQGSEWQQEQLGVSKALLSEDTGGFYKIGMKWKLTKLLPIVKEALINMTGFLIYCHDYAHPKSYFRLRKKKALAYTYKTLLLLYITFNLW